METYLAHHGILGMKWGVRRYQNEDGSLTAAGKKRYDKMEAYRTKLAGKAKQKSERLSERSKEAGRNIRDLKENGTDSKAYNEWKNNQDAKRAREWEEKNSIVGEDGRRYVLKYEDSLASVARNMADSVNSKTQIQKLISENKETQKSAKQMAERWMASNERLMSTKVSVLTKKSDLRKAYRVWDKQ